MDLPGKTALLSGATGGLGQAIARALANRGATLVLSSRKAAALEELAADLPGEHRVAVADLAEEGAAEALAKEAGDVDVLVANAGLPGTGTLDAFSSHELTRCLRVNLEAPMKLSRELAPGMQRRGEGHMVFVSSLAGKAASARSSIYSATKFGLRGFAFSLREDLWGSGVGVSIVSPGFIRDAGMFADSGAKVPPGLGTSSPEEVGAAVVRAIEQNEAEVAVAPLRQRMLAHFALAAPEWAGRFTRRAGADRMAEDLAGRQSDKR